MVAVYSVDTTGDVPKTVWRLQAAPQDFQSLRRFVVEELRRLEVAVNQISEHVVHVQCLDYFNQGADSSSRK